MTKAQLRKARFASKRMATTTPTPNYYRPKVNRELSDVRQWCNGKRGLTTESYGRYDINIKRYDTIYVYRNDTIPYHLRK